jgi:hypothetical protein
MYVAKFTKNGIRWKVILFEKRWLETMLSNEIDIINTKKFFFHSNGYRWANKEIARHLFKQHKLEIIDG